MLQIETYFGFLIRKIEHEDNLINQRTNWSLGLQGFLFTAFAVTVSSENFGKAADAGDVFLTNQQYFMSFFLLLIAVVGAWSAAVTWRGVRAAMRALAELKRGWESAYPENDRRRFPIAYLAADTRSQAFAFAYVAPIALLAAWVLLGVLDLVHLFAGDGSLAGAAFGTLQSGVTIILKEFH